MFPHRSLFVNYGCSPVAKVPHLGCWHPSVKPGTRNDMFRKRLRYNTANGETGKRAAIINTIY